MDRRTRVAWIAAGLVVLVSAIVGIRLVREGPSPQAAAPPPPGGGTQVLTGPAPDISGLSPRQQFDRLYDRVMEATQRGDSAWARRFIDHALSAYAQLDSVDADARYHAAVLSLEAGAFERALALADSILMAHPRHLLGFLVRGAVAERRGDAGALRRAQEAFLAAWTDTERSSRKEYQDHQTALDAFRRSAEAARSRPPPAPPG